MSIAPVVRTVTVPASAEHAFSIFTDRIGDWWPLSTHTPAGEMPASLAFRDRSLVEASDDGVEAVRGSVTEWDPPRRLALTWLPYDGPVTTVTVDFEPSGGQTRVILTHDGWEAFEEAAETARESYDREFAWRWVLALYALAAGGTPSAAEAGKAYDGAPLRAGYEAVALALGPEVFDEPPAGEWNAREVAGHVITNAELMSAVVDDVRAGRPARLYGPDDHAVFAIGRCDGAPYSAAMWQIRCAGAELIARCCTLSDVDLATPVSTYIEHHGEPVVDGDMTLGRLLMAEVQMHLPAHVEQIAALASAD